MYKWMSVIGFFCLFALFTQLVNIPNGYIFKIAESVVLVAGGFFIIRYFDKKERPKKKVAASK